MNTRKDLPEQSDSFDAPSADDARFMRRALALAEAAAEAGEVPVGAVVVLAGGIIGEGANRPIGDRDPTAHAEIVALRDAARALGAYRLPGTTVYVTLEPCPMCVGAMIHARVERIVYAAPDPKTGACGGAIELHDHSSHNHHIVVERGPLAEASGELMRRFFRDRRRSRRTASED